MPAYDCGDPECVECEREFGPDRSDAITRRAERKRAMCHRCGGTGKVPDEFTDQGTFPGSWLMDCPEC